MVLRRFSSLSRVRGFFFVLKFFFTLFVIGALTVIVTVFSLTKDMPSLDHIKITVRNPCVIIQSEDGQILGTYGDRYEDMVRVQDLPPYVPKALLAVEDRRFYHHMGVNVTALMRAAYKNYKAGRVVQGGSTITQQLAKNILFSVGAFLPTDRTFKRKVQELVMALQLEWKFTKNDILTLYLNRVDFGSGTFGIDAASRKFFNKPARELTLFESAVLAGVLKATTAYSPLRSPEKAIARAKLVLELMKEEGFIEDIHTYLDQGQKDLLLYQTKQRETIDAKYFADWVFSQIPNFVGSIDQDMIVVTTFNPETQNRCKESIKIIFDQMASALKVSESAMIVMNFDGGITAMIGGMNYEKSQFNRATQAIRQPGSAFKPIVYLAALEAGMTPETLVDDTPYVKEVGHRIWKLGNFGWQSQGEISLQLALAKSVNAVSARLMEQVGATAVMETAKRLGITRDLHPDLSLAIGTGETTLLEMTTVFATFGNGGKAVWPYAVSEIRNKEGHIIYAREENEPKILIKEDTSASMRLMLRGVVEEGTGRAANVSPDIGGKTGSSANKDAWFLGYDTHQTVGIWVGNDNNSPMDRKSTGGRMPARIAGEFFKKVKERIYQASAAA